MLAFLKL
ncbi:uncharacterized protein FFNC_02624 [Fusarium fujikuroi]|nr:uncharacterized protein FFNC_02624 [Fusarium fujikuroi]